MTRETAPRPAASPRLPRVLIPLRARGGAGAVGHHRLDRMVGRAPHVCSDPTCSRVVEYGKRCPEHGRTQWQNSGQRTESSRRTGIRKFNKTIRPAVFRRDGFVCQLNLEGVCVSRGKPLPATELECDHIIEVAHGGSDDVEQCRTVCIPCHRRRTATDAGLTASQALLAPAPPRPRRKPAPAERAPQIPRTIFTHP
jgi:5-methylcytosine-specific restriction protein A